MARLPRSVVCTAAALSIWVAAAAAAERPLPLAASVDADPIARPRLIDVPYLPQTEDLCGGAAVAMVLRYWGDRQVYPEDFATLVDRSASGIRTDVLTADVRRRGWQAFPFETGASATGEEIGAHVARGRPIVALIEVRPGRYHYVVIVAWTAEHVVVHDPARSPFRVLSQPDFDRAWASAGRWALLLLPLDDRPPDPEARAVPLTAGTPAATLGACGPLVQEMVALARAGEVGRAETGLLAATVLCPGDPAAWHAIAGVRFRQSRWAEAATLTARAVELDPGDAQGWDLLATSRFLNDEPDRALDAWNRIGRPSVDLVRVEGARRTRYPVIAGLVDLPPRTLLTAEGRGLAARRLQALPSAALTQLRYHPTEGGLAEVEAVVVERATVPRGVAPLAAAAARAWLQREIRLDVATASGSGELWTVAWRWWEARPRLAVALAVPSPAWLPGITTIEGSWERPSYAAPDAEQPGAGAVHRTERRRAAVGLADWATSRVRWEAGAALDRWAQDSHLSVNAALDLRLAGDRVSLGVDTGAWAPFGSARRFARGGVSSAWRSTRDTSRRSWVARTGLTATSAAAPLDLWPGAGTGHARTPLVRAHPLLDAGVVRGPVFGRRLAHGTVEYRHPLRAVQGATIQLAAFADTARAWGRRENNDRPPWHADIGTGIRIALPGQGGTARVDVARGLRDGRVAVSAGWLAPWPER